MAMQGISNRLYLLPQRSRNASWGGVWARLTLMAQARRTRRLLAEMDDRMLSDIGLSRADAHMEASRPAWDVARQR